MIRGIDFRRLSFASTCISYESFTSSFVSAFVSGVIWFRMSMDQLPLHSTANSCKKPGLRVIRVSRIIPEWCKPGVGDTWRHLELAKISSWGDMRRHYSVSPLVFFSYSLHFWFTWFFYFFTLLSFSHCISFIVHLIVSDFISQRLEILHDCPGVN
jgi:hypothetical protein